MFSRRTYGLACVVLLTLFGTTIEFAQTPDGKSSAEPAVKSAATNLPQEPDRKVNVRQHLISMPSDEPYQAFYGAHIQRTMTLLETSNQERRWPVRILLYGQSIVGAAAFTDYLNDFFHERYPYADVHLENRAIGGFTGDRLVRTAVHDLYPYYPDLLIFHVYGGQNTGDLERIISNVRRYTTADIVLFNDHHVKNDEISETSANYFRYLAAKYDCELVEVSREWPRYLSEHHLQAGDLLRDNTHPSIDGNVLLTALIERHLRYNPLFSDPWDSKVRSYEAKRPLAEGVNDEIALSGEVWSLVDDAVIGQSSKGRLHLEFTGNRVDLIAGHVKAGDKLGTARVLLDGKPPSVNSGTVYFTRPSTGPGTWFPAVRRISHTAPLVAEDWTLRITSINADATEFTFDVSGSKTGPDGSGKSTEKFCSKSGRVCVDPSDWMQAPIMKIFKQTAPPPVGYEVHWSAVPTYVDVYQTPESVDGSRMYSVTLAQGMSNSKHTLDVIPNGDGPVVVQAIQVYRPPLHQQE